MTPFGISSYTTSADNTVEMADMIVPQNSHHSQKKPIRLVLLACVIIVLTSLTYALHTICSFLLKISENETFIAEVADILKCESKAANFTSSIDGQCKPGFDSLS